MVSRFGYTVYNGGSGNEIEAVRELLAIAFTNYRRNYIGLSFTAANVK